VQFPAQYSIVISGLATYLLCRVRIVVLSEWQCKYVYAPTVAGIDGVGVLDADDLDEVVSWMAEVLVELPGVTVEEEVDRGESEYKFSP
jgi:hypothetical protein